MLLTFLSLLLLSSAAVYSFFLGNLLKYFGSNIFDIFLSKLRRSSFFCDCNETKSFVILIILLSKRMLVD